MKKNYYYILLILLFFSSCVSNNSILYMQEDNEDIPAKALQEFSLQKTSYQLQEGDILQVQIVSLDPDINKIFGEAGNTTIPINTVESPLVNLLGFVINNRGNIKLPIIGDVFVLDMTISDAEVAIQGGVNQYLKGASATCKLISPRITILGEVNRPGTYPIYRNEFNILEAIGLAGDLTITGDRTNIRILRPKGDTQTMHVVNITRKNFLEGEGFYLQPNDVVYISSTDARTKRSNIPIGTTLLTTVLSILTTGLVVFNAIKN